MTGQRTEKSRKDLLRKKMMKMTQLFKIYWPDNGGGIAKVMEYLAEGFPECEQEMIVCQDSPKKKPADDSYHGVAVHRCKQILDFASTPLSVQYVLEVRKRTKNSDIVIYHFPYPMADLAILFGMYSGSLVVWWHCGFQKYRKLAFFYRPLVLHTLKKADRILVSSKGNIENSDILKRFRNKCSVIPYCVSREYLERGQMYAFQAERRGKTKQRGEKAPLCILFIGRLVWYKGCDILLKAFAAMHCCSDCRLVLVGSGPLEQELKKLAASLKLRKVIFTGMVSEEEKMRWIERCDFLVLPSISEAEAFAVVQLEAMAFGKPVINTALKSGVPHVSVDGVTGRTVKPGSIRELAAAMEELEGNEELRREYGTNALHMVQKEYTPELMIERHRKVFRRLV